MDSLVTVVNDDSLQPAELLLVEQLLRSLTPANEHQYTWSHIPVHVYALLPSHKDCHHI